MPPASGSHEERAARTQVEMTMSSDVPQAPRETPEKDPQDWTTGEEPMTGPQRSYLQTLAQEAGESVPDALTKADASRLIDRLQQKTGRGR
jgi:Protein of unknown function (DUF3072)